VKVEVPDEVGWALVERSFALNLPVEVVVGQVLGGVGGPTRARLAVTEDIRQAVGRLVDGGLCDAAIAEATHYTVGYVADIRRSLGLKANRRYPRRSNPSLTPEPNSG
jgi:hypothetical protein